MLEVFFIMQKSMLVCLIFIASAHIAVAQYDYGELIEGSMLFYEAQRSGKLPADNRIPWRGDSALNDRGQNGEDLVGGYYDAGDLVKFGFPMAHTVVILSWGFLSNKAGYEAAGQTQYFLNTIKWATDYFIKAHVAPHKFYAQVGNGTLDHSLWGRPEDMTMERPAWYVDEQNPGSDVVGETAAAFAAASMVFRDYDASYASELLDHARTLYDFADQFRGKYSDAISDAALWYNSYEFKDEIVWAAIWLYKATEEQSYLDAAEEMYAGFYLNYRPPDFGWDNKAAGIQVLLAQLTSKADYNAQIQEFCDYMINERQRTPKGLVYIMEWGTLRWAINIAFICLEASNAGIGDSTTYVNFAQEQLHYALGSTGRSFIVGYGTNPPTHVHNRPASCPDPPTECGWNVYNGNQPNYHINAGAMTGGPDQYDNYEDSRPDATHNEPTCDYNAAYTGVLAYFNSH